jgi:hypothetical protein
MKPLMLLAAARIAFGAVTMAAPRAAGRALAGAGGAEPDAQAFLRGMGGREIGLGLGLFAAARDHATVKSWLVAILLADSSDIAGIAGAWRHMPPSKRLLGLAMAGGAAIVDAAALTEINRHGPGRLVARECSR